MNTESFWAQYARYGWSFIPVQPRSKKPLLHAWKQFQDRRPTLEEQTRWESQHPHANVAVVCGAVSGLIVLDIDSAAGFKWLKQNGCDCPPSPRVESSPGKLHIYFQHPGFTVKNLIRKVPGIDLKGDGGYVVAPPSMHPSGASYHWLEDMSPEDVPVAPCPPWLLEFIDPNKQPPPPEEAIPPPEGSPPGTVALHPPEIEDDIDKEYLARALSVGVEAGARNSTCTKITGHLIARGHSRDLILTILTLWNTKNMPPLDDSEIERIVSSILRSEATKKVRESPHLNPNSTDANGSPQLAELDPDELKRAILAGLCDQLGIPLRNICKVTGDNPQYFFLVGDNEITMGSNHLISQLKFRTKIMEATDILIPHMKPTVWDRVLQAILRGANIVMAGEDATAVGELKWHIVDYLSRPHLHSFDEDPDTPIKETNDPFILKGRVYLNKESFLKWLTSYKLVARPDGKTISQLFTHLGLRYTKIWVANMKKQVRVWLVPVELYILVAGQKKEEEEAK